MKRRLFAREKNEEKAACKRLPYQVPVNWMIANYQKTCLPRSTKVNAHIKYFYINTHTHLYIYNNNNNNKNKNNNIKKI